MKCKWCKHTKDQHDEDGFCEVDSADTGFCDCPGYEAKDSQGENAE
jgi:hypothetical protein